MTPTNRRHSREDLLSAAVEETLHTGLHRLTFASVAQRAGVPDRTIVYYFPTKADLVRAVVDASGLQLLRRLEAALGGDRRDPRELRALMWPLLTGPDLRPVLQVWLEVCVRAGTTEEPYLTAARRLTSTWLTWLADRVDATTPAVRERAAAAVLARLDGALLLHHIGLDELAALSLADDS